MTYREYCPAPTDTGETGAVLSARDVYDVMNAEKGGRWECIESRYVPLWQGRADKLNALVAPALAAAHAAGQAEERARITELHQAATTALRMLQAIPLEHWSNGSKPFVGWSDRGCMDEGEVRASIAISTLKSTLSGPSDG
jgi:hypothetical protein